MATRTMGDASKLSGVKGGQAGVVEMVWATALAQTGNVSPSNFAASGYKTPLAIRFSISLLSH